jgi:hypothetical protein
MPTTGEFGPRSGFGDYEEHKNLATRLGGHFTFSPEDRQSQPAMTISTTRRSACRTGRTSSRPTRSAPASR